MDECFLLANNHLLSMIILIILEKLLMNCTKMAVMCRYYK